METPLPPQWVKRTAATDATSDEEITASTEQQMPASTSDHFIVRFVHLKTGEVTPLHPASEFIMKQIETAREMARQNQLHHSSSNSSSEITLSATEDAAWMPFDSVKATSQEEGKQPVSSSGMYYYNYLTGHVQQVLHHGQHVLPPPVMPVRQPHTAQTVVAAPVAVSLSFDALACVHCVLPFVQAPNGNDRDNLRQSRSSAASNPKTELKRKCVIRLDAVNCGLCARTAVVHSQ